jgi:hypothetical protein
MGISQGWEGYLNYGTHCTREFKALLSIALGVFNPDDTRSIVGIGIN